MALANSGGFSLSFRVYLRDKRNQVHGCAAGLHPGLVKMLHRDSGQLASVGQVGPGLLPGGSVLDK